LPLDSLNYCAKQNCDKHNKKHPPTLHHLVVIYNIMYKVVPKIYVTCCESHSQSMAKHSFTFLNLAPCSCILPNLVVYIMSMGLFQYLSNCTLSNNIAHYKITQTPKRLLEQRPIRAMMLKMMMIIMSVQVSTFNTSDKSGGPQVQHSQYIIYLSNISSKQNTYVEYIGLACLGDYQKIRLAI
jgi:hypothetical protein